jgi:hypothetical protein
LAELADRELVDWVADVLGLAQPATKAAATATVESAAVMVRTTLRRVIKRTGCRLGRQLGPDLPELGTELGVDPPS